MNAKTTGTLLLTLAIGLTATAQKQKGGNRGEGGGKSPAQKYTIEQAVSDRAQLHTICFSGLAFITGDYGASTFIPPGKVCDYFGFQRNFASCSSEKHPIVKNCSSLGVAMESSTAKCHGSTPWHLQQLATNKPF